MAVSSNRKEKILVLRFHAFGDLLAILPYVNALRQARPQAEIHLLTTAQNRLIPEQLLLFDQVISVKGKMNAKLVFAYTILKIPQLLLHNYKKVIDLQGDQKANVILRLIGGRKKTTFDKYGPYFAGLRYQRSINAMGYDTTYDFKLRRKEKTDLGKKKLLSCGWDGTSELIVLNPAGFFETRNWPLANYMALIALLQEKLTYAFRILFVGDQRIREKAEALTATFPDICINTVGKTTQLEAFEILPNIRMIISEDSGLAHMAWVQGVKTCLMLGSTRADWTAPPYEHVINLTSSDLACGDCMQPTCQHGDVRCLSRYSPQFILDKIEKWL